MKRSRQLKVGNTMQKLNTVIVYIYFFPKNI